MNNLRAIVAITLFLLASCGEKEPVATETLPAVRADLQNVTAFDATFTVQALNAASVR